MTKSDTFIQYNKLKYIVLVDFTIVFRKLVRSRLKKFHCAGDARLDVHMEKYVCVDNKCPVEKFWRKILSAGWNSKRVPSKHHSLWSYTRGSTCFAYRLIMYILSSFERFSHSGDVRTAWKRFSRQFRRLYLST